MFNQEREEVLHVEWRAYLRKIEREFRTGFEAGYFGNYVDMGHRMSEAWSQGHACGRELIYKEYALSAAPEQGYEDVTYEQMAKGA
tara:strand:+ start:1764 stop:2021 length:258 start_codon:yes stop_codon:yes gene_type:complete